MRKLFSPVKSNRIGIVVLFLIVCALGVLFLRPQNTVEVVPGEVYLRYGLPDSSLISTIMESSPNLAGELLVGILAYDRPVKIDTVGLCPDIFAAYEADSTVIAVPLFLDGTDEECWSYQLRFDLTEADQIIPVWMSIIHPVAHSALLTDLNPYTYNP